ncbi:MAG: carboxymuconolactone decarboxylase family protein [Erysipelotrichaceae bacterium]|nr:carboxymuconolactone decarboxylase family protein [Erysipelotrichaceae bacterium]
MALTQKADDFRTKITQENVGQFEKSDPEFYEFFANFAFDEVVNQSDLDDRTGFISTIAVLLGCGGIDEFKVIVPGALNFGVTPVEIKEVIYQATAYLGIGRVFPFLKAVNQIFAEHGVVVDPAPRSTTTRETRQEKGTAAQVAIFGDHMQDFWKTGPEDTVHINYWLASNCFGDYYTRVGLDYNMREMITFCFLYAQGGCESQLRSHTTANMRLGNDKAFLLKIISRNVPFIGYPRTLNALAVINEVAKDFE